MFDTIDLQRFAVSAVGALTLSAACVFGAVGPAKAATTDTLGAWQTRVERNIDAAMNRPVRLGSGQHAMATLGLRFDAQGHFAGAGIRQTSGSSAIDRTALKVAQTISYPRLPENLHGRPRTVAMQLYFGNALDEGQAAAMRNEARTLALVAKGDVEITKTNNVALAGL